MSNTYKERSTNKPGGLQTYNGVLYKTTFRKASTYCNNGYSTIYKYCAFFKDARGCNAPFGATCLYQLKLDSTFYIKVRYLKIRNLKEKHCVNRNKE